MPRPTLLVMTALLSTAALAAGPGQPGAPGSPMGELSTPCPPGWRLQGRIKRHGDFSCRPAPDNKLAASPAMALDCPANTRYFISASTRRLGCAYNAAKSHPRKHQP